MSGVEASSSASLAAYLNSLTYSVEETPGWFFGSAKGAWRIRGGAFCSFNAFSRVDVRVEVKIPGGVDAYVVDLRGERYVDTASELQLTRRLQARGDPADLARGLLVRTAPCYPLRGRPELPVRTRDHLRLDSRRTRRLAGFRKLDPITTLEAELRFVAAAEAAFFKGASSGHSRSS